MITIDTPVVIVGDLIGEMCLLDLPKMIGKHAVVESSQGEGFWWVRLSEDNNRILLHENELKVVDAS